MHPKNKATVEPLIINNVMRMIIAQFLREYVFITWCSENKTIGMLLVMSPICAIDEIS